MLPAGEIETSAQRFPVGKATMSDGSPGSVLMTTNPLPCAGDCASRPAAVFASAGALACVGAGAGADGGGTGNAGCDFVGSVKSVSGVLALVAVNVGAGAVTACLFGTAGLESLG